MNQQDVRGLHEVDETQRALVGGKGAYLGALSRIEGVSVPPGFCVTTHAFGRTLAGVPSIGDKLDQLARLDPDDREAVRALAARIRRDVEEAALPEDLAAEITRAVKDLGEHDAYAVRSSATAEDLPTASFAGQQDTYLNVVGAAAVLRDVRRCWASLFTERAVAYRQRNGIDHRAVRMAVVVQKMVLPQVAGVLFTADPVTSNRTVASVEAGFGLGEALVAGLVDPDTYRVRDGRIVERSVAAKRVAVHALPGGGTTRAAVEPRRQREPALTDEQVLRLVRLGRRIEAHFGRPQGIEWCLVDDEFHVVQSRPVTTLFPVPEADDDANHVYVSVGHQQMMTDAMKPLGWSMWQLTAIATMHAAGGRLFVDVTDTLTSPARRAGLLELVGRGDPLVRDALETVVDRGDFLPEPPDQPTPPPPPRAAPEPVEADPATVTELVSRSEAALAALRRDIAATSGPARFDSLLAAFEEHKRLVRDPLSMQVIMAGMDASWWLNEHLREWLGEKNAADTLTLSAPGNITSEMGLALLDVADVVRPHPEVVAFLEKATDDGFLDELPALPGGELARDAIHGWLDRHGMRCVGEIDITRPRWSERPVALIPLLLENVRNFPPGERERRFERGRRAAAEKERDVLARLRTLPDGQRRADETKRMIDRVRTFIGYREYPKYAIVGRYLVYKQALLAEAADLVRDGVLRTEEDSWFLTFTELHDAVRTRRVDRGLISRRREEFRSYRTLTPPRVLTSDGECLDGAYRRDDVPAGALVGLPVSTGVVEGRARIVHDIAAADLEPGDILVTAFTDPSWSPLFVAVAGLVTEVGGLMTHGAVIAREYGLPAVVGVADATRLIRDGQRIRVHGGDGYVELLS
ncbi:rifamycin-inactivating phosphotransferase [Micromonospora mirobrigensis]|uniref:Rifampicin phosphotransferase n=1 Tax=Micromonospora mirobrigensis TaxID=262898 RepID=A0A1C4YVP9_9ACTN|nr:rifamycin-inactivating phosphotransferase [Micromonospora mirobrigensis]SCF24726.1 pyruvate, water dikinase [Micromonospora mirobrigensis]